MVIKIKTLSELIQTIVPEYIKKIRNPKNKTPEQYGLDLLNEICKKIEIHNAGLPKGIQKLRIPEHLNAYAIAQLANKIYIFRNISLQALKHSETEKLENSINRDETELFLYLSDTGKIGTYTNNDTSIFAALHKIAPIAPMRTLKDAISFLRIYAPLAERETNPNLVPVENGIFNYKTKELLPFSPNHIFLTKCPIPYDPNAKNPIIHNPDDQTDWDVISWIREIADDNEEIETLLWNIITAILLYGYPWNKCFWFYSPKGNNGKGTFCQLLKNVVGSNNFASLSISDFGENFALTGLETKMAVITDENDVGEYIQKVGKLKALVTGDTVNSNRKYKNPITLTFKGLVVQCVNKIPKIQDDSDSWARRLVLVPFHKCFTGRERKYIKEDYLLRADVLMYVLKQALEDTITEITVPQECINLLNEYKEMNNPIVSFLNDLQDQFVWDLIPYNFLYDLYLKWSEKNNPNGKPKGRKNFTKDLKEILDANPDWQWNDTRKSIRSMNRMEQYEPLILEYDLKTWMNPEYKGNDPQKKCDFPRARSYYGITRTINSHNDTITQTNTPCQDSFDTNPIRYFPNGIPIQMTNENGEL